MVQAALQPPKADLRACKAAAAASLASAVRVWKAAAAPLSRHAWHDEQGGTHAQPALVLCQGELLEAGMWLQVALAVLQGPSSEQLAQALVRFGSALVHWRGLTCRDAPATEASHDPVRALLEALASACRLGLASTAIEAVSAVTGRACLGQLSPESENSTWEVVAVARGCLPSAAPLAALAPGSSAHSVPWRSAHHSKQDVDFTRQLKLFRRRAVAGAEAGRAAAAAAAAAEAGAAPASEPAASAAAAGPAVAGSHAQHEHAPDSHGPAAAPAWRLVHMNHGFHVRGPGDPPPRLLGHTSTRPLLPTQARLSILLRRRAALAFWVACAGARTFLSRPYSQHSEQNA